MNNKKNKAVELARCILSRRLQEVLRDDINECESFGDVYKLCREVLYSGMDIPFAEIVDAHCNVSVVNEIALRVIEHVHRRYSYDTWFCDSMTYHELIGDILNNVDKVRNCDTLLHWIELYCQWNVDYLEEVLDSIYSA